MNADERIETALGRRPSDERTYDGPLAPLGLGEGVQRVRPVVRSKTRLGSLAAVAMVLVLAAVGVGVATVGLSNGRAAQSGGPGNSVPLTGLIGCGGLRPGFSPDFIYAAGIAETLDSGPSAALRSRLAAGGSNVLPSSRWVLVAESANDARFMAFSGSTFSWVYVDVHLGSSDSGGSVAGWSAVGWGDCELYSVPPDGDDIATWTVDPAHPYVAGATELHMLVTELACYGEDAVGTFESNVAYGNAAVTITAFVRHAGAPIACTASPATYLVVLRLDRPLGGLAIADGGPWPAKTRSVNGLLEPTSTPGVEVTIPPIPVPSSGCSIVPVAAASAGCGSTPTQVPAAVSTNEPTPAPTYLTYKIRSGDNADNIAARFNVKLWELELANPQIADFDHIVVGQTLNIPQPGQFSQPTAAPSAP
jgi:LysM repeat protein